MRSFHREKEFIHQILWYLASQAYNAHRSLAPSHILTKEDGTPVTVYDFYFQAVMNRAIGTLWPSDPIMAEETSAVLKENGVFLEKITTLIQIMDPTISPEGIYDLIDYSQSTGGREGRFWVIDPIDGTRGFIHGGQYALALALIVQGEVCLAGLCCPDFAGGQLLIAEKGHGALCYTLDGASSHPLTIEECDFQQHLPYFEAPSATSQHDRPAALQWVKSISLHPEPTPLDSQCKYAGVALNQAPLYIRYPKSSLYKEKIWDHAAGALIVEEAEGQVTDIDGKKLDFGAGQELMHNRGIVAASKAIHRAKKGGSPE